MVKAWLKVLALDVVLLVAALEVLLDVQNRVNCALGSPLYGQGCMARSSPSYAYSLLTQWFSLVVNGSTLQSPPTLDWVQVVVVLLAAINGWYAYKVLRPGRPPADVPSRAA